MPVPRQRSPAGTVVPSDPETITVAGALLRTGRLIAFPTETVYGLGCDATSDAAVAAVFAAKGRPQFNPLIVHVATPDEALALVDLDRRALALASRFWPGPLTLVARRRPDCPVSLLASAGLGTIAVRIPDHPVALALIRAAGVPVAAPSANRSGAVSPTTAAHVAESLGAATALILDGGPCRVGVESTVIDVTGTDLVLLRPGGITADAAADVVGQAIRPAGALADPTGTAPAPRSPGMLDRHYAPGRPVRLDAHDPRPGEALLGFGHHPAATLNLSPTSDLAEAAANLFAMLRALDRPGVTAIAVSPIPDFGLGLAINDRLRRAARQPPEANDDRGPAGPCVLGDDP